MAAISTFLTPPDLTIWISQEVRVTRELSHPNIVKVVGASTRGQADILHNLTSEVLIVFPLYQVVV